MDHTVHGIPYLTLSNPMDFSTPGFPALHCLLEFAQTHVHWVSDAIQSSHTLSSPSLPSIFPSIRVFSNGSVLHIRWPKYWNFSFSISPSNEYSGLISIGWTGLISLQSKGLSRAFNTTVRKHQFLALSLLYSPTLTYICDYWKNYSLPIWIFVGKVMSLVFTML